MPYLLEAKSLRAGQEFRTTCQQQPDLAILFPVWLTKKILRQHTLQYVGKGAESIVFSQQPLPHHIWHKFWHRIESLPHVLISIQYRDADTPTASKERYYLHRILTALFPQNFPRIYGTFTTAESTTGMRLSGAFREEKQAAHFWKTPDYPIQRIKDFIKELNFPITDLDTFSGNYRTAPDGGEYYLDLLELAHQHRSEDDTFIPAEWETEKLLEFMRQESYSSSDISTVMKCIQRLGVLAGQRVAELNQPV